MRTVASLLVVLCAAAGPATAPATKPALAPETREREGKVTVDAINGGDFRLRVVKGDVYTFKVSGEWQNIEGKPWGPEGRGDGENRVSRKFYGERYRTNGTLSGELAIGKELRWTVSNSGFLAFPGLENRSARTERRSGQMIVSFKRVVTGKDSD